MPKIGSTPSRRVSRVPYKYTNVALAYVWLGRHGAALDWLERAYEAGDIILPFVNGMRDFEPLRGEPRFQALMDRMNLG